MAAPGAGQPGDGRPGHSASSSRPSGAVKRQRYVDPAYGSSAVVTTGWENCRSGCRWAGAAARRRTARTHELIGGTFNEILFCVPNPQ